MNEIEFKKELSYDYGFSENEINDIVDIQRKTFTTFQWTLETIKYIKNRSMCNTEKLLYMLEILLDYNLYINTH